MTSAEDRSPLRGSAWGGVEPPPPPPVRQSAMSRFLGGSPLSVLFRLLLLSFIVGALLMWLDIRPQDVVFAFERFVRHIWSLGFTAIREMGDYLAAGALIVVPVWLVIRLLNFRGPH